MVQASLSMRKIEEILRLKYGLGLPHRAIAKSCWVSTSTVSEYVTHAKAAGLSWPLPEGLTTEQLEAQLYPDKGGPRRKVPQPDGPQPCYPGATWNRQKPDHRELDCRCLCQRSNGPVRG